MAKKILGLDICSDGICAVLLKRGVKTHGVEACLHIVLPEGSEFDDALGTALEKLSTQMDISDVTCAASFPAERISYRNIQVPFRAPRKIRQVLPFELEPSLPFAVEDTVWAYQSLARDHQTELLAVAADKMGFDAYLARLNQHGLDPVSVSPSGYALAMLLAERISRQDGDSDNCILVDLGEQAGTLFVLVDGRIRTIRALVRRTSYPWSVKSVAATIRQTLGAFSELIPGGYTPERALITGYGLLDVNLESELADLLAMPMERMDLLRAPPVDISNEVSERWRPHQMDKPLALALTGFGSLGRQLLDFRNGSAPRSRFWDQNRRPLATAALLTALVVGLMGFGALMETRILEQRLARLNTSVTEVFQSAFPDVKNIVDPLQQMRVKLREVDKRLPAGMNIRPPVMEILDDISRRIPGSIDVAFSRFVIGNDDVQITAETDTFNSVDEIKNRLAASEKYSKVDISSANMDKRSKRVRFKLKLQLA